MILHLMKCEACENKVSINPQARRPYDLPDGWYVLFNDSPQISEGWQFCSLGCLTKWAKAKQNDDDAKEFSK